MTKPKRMAAIAAGLGLTVASLSGCQWLAENAPGFPTPDPKPSITSSETQQERTMRLDKQAVEKAYLTANAEVDRLAMAGGATKPTKVLRATTDGFYLKVQMAGLKVIKENGWRADRPAVVSVSTNGGWSPTSIGLTACEDSSKVKLIDGKGKEVAKARDRRYVQTLTATKEGGVWKITDGESKAVKSFANEGGCTT